MAFKNLIDDTSTVVSPSTPGVVLDMRHRTTMSRESLGVPVRFWVYASGVDGDTGAVLLLDSTGATLITVPVNGDEGWYVQDGHVPATLGKYDPHYGGNTLGALTVKDFQVEEYADVSPNQGALAATLGAVTSAATGTVADSLNAGTLAATLGPVTSSATGTVEVKGSATPTLGPITANATGTVSSSWTLDATSGKGVPANATEWAAVMSAAGIATGNPSLLWLMQEASNNLADSIGSFTGTASGTGLTYFSSVTGWSRKGVLSADGATGKFTNTDSGLPDVNTTSCLVLSYVKFNSTPGTYRNVQTLGTTTQARGFVKVAAGPLLEVFSGGNGNSGASDPTGAVRPFVLQIDQTANVIRWITDQETMTPTFDGSMTGKKVEIVGGANGAPDATTLYTAVFVGAAAELTRTQIKTLLQTLGWSPSWTP